MLKELSLFYLRSDYTNYTITSLNEHANILILVGNLSNNRIRIKVGNMQGCVPFLRIFGLSLEFIVTEALDDCDADATIGGRMACDYDLRAMLILNIEK